MKKSFFPVMLVVLILVNHGYLWGQQAIYYVSTGGIENNPGTQSSPFQTITKARDVVDGLNGNMSGDIIINLMGGTYFITNTIIFDEGDSGTDGYRVIYQAYNNNEKIIIFGGFQVTGWTQHSGNIRIWPALGLMLC